MNHLQFIHERRERIIASLEALSEVLHQDQELLAQINMAEPTVERAHQSLVEAISNLHGPHMLYHFERGPTGWVCYDDNYEPPDILGVGGGPVGQGLTKADALEDLIQ